MVRDGHIFNVMGGVFYKLRLLTFEWRNALGKILVWFLYAIQNECYTQQKAYLKHVHRMYNIFIWIFKKFKNLKILKMSLKRHLNT